MACLVRKYPYVARGRGLHPELQVMALHLPSWWKGPAEFPLALMPGVRFGEFSVCCFPTSGRECGRPLRLRFRANEGDFAEALEFLAVAAVEQLVVGPVRREQLEVAGHFRSSSRALRRA